MPKVNTGMKSMMNTRLSGHWTFHGHVRTLGFLSAQIVVKPVAVDSMERKKQQQGLNYLIGYSLDNEASDRLGELIFTRRKLASPSRRAKKL